MNGRPPTKHPWLPLFIDDWRGSPRVQAMTKAQRCMYLELLMAQWDSRPGSLPGTVDELAAILQIPPADLAPHLPVLAPCFTRTKGGRWVNRKIAQVRRAARRTHDRKVIAGRKGGATSIWNSLSRQPLRPSKPDPDPDPEKTRARARASSSVDYLAACPHTPRCARPYVCGKRREVEAAVADRTITPAEGARLVQLWLLEPAPPVGVRPQPARQRGTR